MHEEGAGEPVVFIQGVGLHGDGWLPQTTELRKHFRTITFDNRGMGASQPAALPLTVEQMAVDTIAIMDAKGIASAHLVGHSMGGCIAQKIALAVPHRVKSLSLLCTSACGADATKLSWKMLWLGLRTRLGTRNLRRFAFLRMVLSKEYLATHDREQTALQLAPLFGHDLGDTPPVVMKQLKALKKFDVSTRLASLAGIPTLVISAVQDIIFPPHCGHRLARQICGAKYLEIAPGAHGVTIERADLINKILLQHMQASHA